VKSHYAEGIQLPEVRMSLACQKAFLVAAALTMACRESTAPSAVAGVYRLENIDGRPLPANIQAGQGDTITVLWSTLTLNGLRNAALTERLRIVHPGAPAFEQLQSTDYLYSITGHGILGEDISFEYSPPCPINAICVGPPTGKVLGTTLILSYGGFQGTRPQSFYRRADYMVVID
jgi:hypothetical protein